MSSSLPNEEHRPIWAYVNRSARGKIPRDAPRQQWAQFHSQWEPEQMTARELAESVYRGFSFAPIFDGRKTKSHFIEAWHMALDFDCGDDRARFDNLMADDLIDWFSSFLYYTPSSSPPAYKARAVFVFDRPVQSVDEYEDILKAFAWRFPDSDQSTTDAARFFYGSQRRELLPNWSILPLDSAAEIVRQWKDARPVASVVEQVNRPVIATTDLEGQIASALAYIPGRLDYREWLTILMAVHSAMPNQRGISLVENWSPGYPGEIEDKFSSFDRAASGGVTIRSLFKMARDNGYRVNGGGAAPRKRNGRDAYDFRGMI